MTLQQLEYIVAVDTYRHFAKAAEACNVTQPTLSMMIQKLEDELDIIIFDRSKHPVLPTEIGEEIVEKARVVLKNAYEIEQTVSIRNGILSGNLHLAVIPTLAPYLVPMFLGKFTKKFPHVKLKISENTTEVIIDKLKRGAIDVGLLVTPINEKSIKEIPLFYEPLVVFSSHPYHKSYILPEDLDPNELWLLEEGHCFRSQILNLCELRKSTSQNIQYECGSLETLKHLVEENQGVTVLPEMSTYHFTAKQKKRLHPFREPVPVREVSLITHRNFYKKRLIDALMHQILNVVPENMKDKKNRRYAVPV